MFEVNDTKVYCLPAENVYTVKRVYRKFLREQGNKSLNIIKDEQLLNGALALQNVPAFLSEILANNRSLLEAVGSKRSRVFSLK